MKNKTTAFNSKPFLCCFKHADILSEASPIAQLLKNPPAMQETPV